MKSHPHSISLIFVFMTLVMSGCKNGDIDITTGKPKDIDGNVYDTIKLGNQVWMKENLRVTRLNDGTKIINPITDAEWIANGKNKLAAYCWTNNDTSYRKPFGALYNEYAVGSDKLAPKGWRIPNSADWDTLKLYLKNYGYNDKTKNPANQGDWDAKSLADSLYWVSYTSKGSVGCEPWKNNNSGFSAVPTSNRGDSGGFGYLGIYAYFWTLNPPYMVAATFDQKFAHCTYIDHMGVRLSTANWYPNTGIPVRCIRAY